MSDRPPLFDDVGNAQSDCEAYVACRDHTGVGKRNARARLERTWADLGHLCPEDPTQFIDQFRRNFHSRAWELWLLAVLKSAGFDLRRPPRKGPDILVHRPGGRRWWIEAVTPMPGVGPDAVFQRPEGTWCGSLFSEEKLLLRYRNSIEEKVAKLADYVAGGIVRPDDVCLVAVCQGAILDSDLHDFELPAIAKAVLPIGEPALVITPYEDAPPEVVVPERASISKSNSAKVSTTLFLEGRAAGISGLLFAQHAVWNMPWSAEESLGLVHNPVARAPFPRKGLPLRCELWVADNKLQHSGVCAKYGAYSRPAN